MIFLAWTIVAAVVLATLFSAVWITSEGFTDWVGFAVIWGILAGIALLIVLLCWAGSYLTAYYSSKKPAVAPTQLEAPQ